MVVHEGVRPATAGVRGARPGGSRWDSEVTCRGGRGGAAPWPGALRAERRIRR